MPPHRCTACGNPKRVDGFRACPGCRAEWRRYSRKPGGPAETIEALRQDNERLRQQNARLRARLAHTTKTET
jgi:hypothetical protein